MTETFTVAEIRRNGLEAIAVQEYGTGTVRILGRNLAYSDPMSPKGFRRFTEIEWPTFSASGNTFPQWQEHASAYLAEHWAEISAVLTDLRHGDSIA